MSVAFYAPLLFSELLYIIENGTVFIFDSSTLTRAFDIGNLRAGSQLTITIHSISKRPF